MEADQNTNTDVLRMIRNIITFKLYWKKIEILLSKVVKIYSLYILRLFSKLKLQLYFTQRLKFETLCHTIESKIGCAIFELLPQCFLELSLSFFE